MDKGFVSSQDEFVQEVIICKRKHSGSSKLKASDTFSFKTKLVFKMCCFFFFFSMSCGSLKVCVLHMSYVCMEQLQGLKIESKIRSQIK